MYKFNKRLVAGAVAAALVMPMAAHATNGILPLGNSMTSHGFGGAGIANGAETMSGVDNPALISRTSEQWGIAASLFMPYRSADFGTGTYVDSAQNYFIIPQGGYIDKINNKFDWGVLAYAMGGMNTDYDAGKINPGWAGDRLGFDLSGFVVAPTASVKLNQDSSLGLSLLLGYESMKTTAPSTHPTLGSNSGSSTGYGFKLGYAGNLGASTTLGVFYQTKIDMGEMADHCSTAKKGALSGVKAAGGDCSLDMPDQYGIGLTQKFGGNVKLVADIMQVNWSNVDVFGYAPAKGGFGWENQTIYKIGAEFKSSESTAWRVGYNYGKSPIPAKNTGQNLLAPAITENHFTFGYGHTMGKSEINAYFAYIPESKQETSGTPNYRAKMNQYALGVGYNSRF